MPHEHVESILKKYLAQPYRRKAFFCNPPRHFLDVLLCHYDVNHLLSWTNWIRGVSILRLQQLDVSFSEQDFCCSGETRRHCRRRRRRRRRRRYHWGCWCCRRCHCWPVCRLRPLFRLFHLCQERRKRPPLWTRENFRHFEWETAEFDLHLHW